MKARKFKLLESAFGYPSFSKGLNEYLGETVKESDLSSPKGFVSVFVPSDESVTYVVPEQWLEEVNAPLKWEDLKEGDKLTLLSEEELAALPCVSKIPNSNSYQIATNDYNETIREDMFGILGQTCTFRRRFNSHMIRLQEDPISYNWTKECFVEFQEPDSPKITQEFLDTVDCHMFEPPMELWVCDNLIEEDPVKREVYSIDRRSSLFNYPICIEDQGFKFCALDKPKEQDYWDDKTCLTVGNRNDTVFRHKKHSTHIYTNWISSRNKDIHEVSFDYVETWQELKGEVPE